MYLYLYLILCLYLNDNMCRFIVRALCVFAIALSAGSL